MTSPTAGPDRPLWDLPEAPRRRPTQPLQPPYRATTRTARHRWMMLICCIPMIVIVLLLVVSGTAGSGAVLWALGCVAMMAAMMFMMPGGHNHK